MARWVRKMFLKVPDITSKQKFSRQIPPNYGRILQPVDNSQFHKIIVITDNQCCNFLMDMILIKIKINLAGYLLDF
jgi:hypothetical protein